MLFKANQSALDNLDCLQLLKHVKLDLYLRSFSIQNSFFRLVKAIKKLINRNYWYYMSFQVGLKKDSWQFQMLLDLSLVLKDY